MKLPILSLTLCLLATPTMADSPTLKSQLEEKAKASADRFPPQVLTMFKGAIETVRGTGIEDSAKQVGDDAPDATAKNWKGETVSLKQLWSQGPVVLMWYRGGWCPYCNLQLQAMQKKLAELDRVGATLVVLTPELPEKAKETAEASKIDLVAVHDAGNQIARKYGIVFQLPDPIVPMYKSRLKLAERNGHDVMELPLAATYVINTQGKITYAFLDADYKKRAEPTDVVAAVNAATK